MKPKPVATILCIFFLALPGAADTFLMRDGSKVEGTVIRQDETSYVVEIQVTKSIKDERVLQKADVLKVKRETPGLMAYEKVEALVPTPDFLGADDYAGRIKEVKKFLKEHKTSAMSYEAKAVLATLEAESAAVLEGSVKVDGEMLSAEQYKADAYGIDARFEAGKIQSLLERKRYLSALRKFDVFRLDFENTGARVKLLPAMMKATRKYSAEVNSLLVSHDARVKRRVSGLKRMSDGDRQTTERAIRDELAALEKRYEAEKEKQLRWVSTHPFFKPALSDTVSYGKERLAEMSRPASAQAVDGAKAYRDAFALIRSNADSGAASVAIANVKSAKVPQRYIDILEKEASASDASP